MRGRSCCEGPGGWIPPHLQRWDFSSSGSKPPSMAPCPLHVTVPHKVPCQPAACRGGRWLSRDAQLQNESAATGRAWPCSRRGRAAPSLPTTGSGQTDTLTSPSTRAPVPAHMWLCPYHPPPFYKLSMCPGSIPCLGGTWGGAARGGSPGCSGAGGHASSPGRGWGGCALHWGCSGKHPAASWQQPLAKLKSPEAGGVKRGGPSGCQSYSVPPAQQ